MGQTEHRPVEAKISPQFAARLDMIKAGQKVRALVMLQVKKNKTITLGRLSPSQRKAMLEDMNKGTNVALMDIDQILKRFDGKRLAPSADALGSIPVETTPEGLKALTTSNHVKAILEDQAISLLS